MKSRLNGLLTVAAAGILALTMVPQANATVELRLTNGSTVLNIVDGDANDQSTVANVVVYAGAVGNWTVVVSTGIANNLPPFLDLGSSTLALGSNPGNLTMEASADNYTPAATAFSFAVGGTLEAGDLYSFSAFIDNGNARFGQTSQLGSTLNFNYPSSSAGSFSGSTAGNLSPSSASPYSITVKAALSGVTGLLNSQTSYDAKLNMSTVPEPAVVTLLGGALLLSMGAIRRKVRRS